MAAERPEWVAARATAVWRRSERRRRRSEKSGEWMRRDQRRQMREREGKEDSGTRERTSRTMSSGREDIVVAGAGEVVCGWDCDEDFGIGTVLMVVS